MSTTKLSDSITVPRWLANRVGRNVGYRLLFVLIVTLDDFIEWAIDGVNASLPGLGTPTALPLIGRSRGILRGPTEDDATFIARLIAWLDAWMQAGSAVGLVDQIRAYLIGQGSLGAGVLPVVRIVDRAGNWVVGNTDGTVTIVSSPWNWDEVLGWDDGVRPQSGATVTGWWSDMWIVVAPPSGTSPIYPLYTGTSDADWLANFGPNATLCLGHKCTLAVADGIVQLIATWKAAHTWIRAVIWPSDATSFAPGTPTADGTFGNVSKNVGGEEVPSRTANARYWIPAGGG